VEIVNDEQQNPSNLYEPLNNVMVRNTKIANTFGAFVKISGKILYDAPKKVCQMFVLL